MPDKKILVPMDFSSQSKSALKYASAFAREFDAELLILHVVDQNSPHVEGLTNDDAMVGLFDALHGVKPDDESLGCSHLLLQGMPAATILKAADEEKVEMIVMGTHGRSGLSRLVMGSVAEEVVRHSQCPVLTLREPIAVPETPPTDSPATV